MKFRQSFWSHLACCHICAREITLSRGEIMNNFMRRDKGTLNSLSVPVSDRTDPAATAGSSSLPKRTNSIIDSAEARQDTNQPDQNELAETFL